MGGVMAIVRHMPVDDRPPPPDRVRMGAIWWKPDRVDADVRARQERPDIGPFMAGRVILDDVDQVLVGIAGLDLGEKRCGTGAADSRRLDARRVEGFRVRRATEIHPSACCHGFDSRI